MAYDPPSVLGESLTSLIVPQGWWRGDDAPTGNVATATPWPDYSGNAHPLVTGFAGTAPVKVAAVLNGRAVVRFAGGSLKSLYPLTPPTTTFMVAKVAAVPGSGLYLYDGLTSANLDAFQYTATNFQLYNGAFLIGAPTDTAWHIHCNVSNNTNSRLRADGGAGIGGTTGNSAAFGGIEVGGFGADGGSAFGLFDLAELITVQGALSPAAMNVVGNYLAARYQLPWTKAS